MTPERFHEICIKASGLAVRDRDRIGNLMLTQAQGNEPTIREPEMLHAFCRTLDGESQSYGIEVPTKKLYRFVDEEGDKTIRARHDLVLLDSVLVELKCGQPSGDEDDYPAISKDLRKLLLEEAAGKAMFHICHASDRGTLPSLMGKYETALRFARARIEASGQEPDPAGWFVLYVLVLYNRNQKGEPHLHCFMLTDGGDAFQADPTRSTPITRG